MKKLNILFSLALSAVLALSSCADSSSSSQVSNTEDPPVRAEYVSEWSFGQTAMGGGGYVPGIFATPTDGLYYARTDVGGAYRYDTESKRWETVSAWIGRDDKGYMGVDGLAFDSNDPKRLFLLAGTEYFNNGKTAVLISSDGGSSFETVEVSDLIRVHGNGTGRGNGERIAVDPSDGNVIYAGGRTGGIIRSEDGGKTWSKTGFAVEKTANGNGVCAIAVSSSGRVYAAVSRKADKNIYYSDDKGSTWAAAEGLPEDMMPQRLRLDSKDTLYITYGADEGPSGDNSKGGIYTLSAELTVADISPANGSKRIGDVVFDPADPSKLAACTEGVWSAQPNGSYGDEFYRSADGGKTWECINDSMTMDIPEECWVNGKAIHWCSSMMLDPFRPGTVMVVSGNGIFRCDNYFDSTPSFTFFSDGLEETVPLECISLPDGEIITAIGDYDGFEQKDIHTRGRQHTKQIGTTTDISVADQAPDIRVKVGDKKGEPNFLYTEDGGDSWSFVTPPSQLAAGGRAVLTADGKNLIWSCNEVSEAYISEDKGKSWTHISGIYGGYDLLADPTDPQTVYACGSGGLMVSSDGGKNFKDSGFFIYSGCRLTADPKTGTVYIPCGDNGLFAVSCKGTSTEKLKNVAICRAIGTGKGRNEDSPQALYIFGKPSSEDPEGIYLSEGSGATWSRVDDDAHRFGGLDNGGFLTGDQSSFGRCYFGTVGLGLAYCEIKA